MKENILILTIFFISNMIKIDEVYSQSQLDKAEIVKLKWINFSPYTLPGQNPNYLSEISESQIITLLEALAPYAEGIRTFGTQYGLEKVPSLAKQRGFKVIAGIWLSNDTVSNAAQIANGIAIANAGYADKLIVGSEVLYRNALSPTQLIKYINQVKLACPQLPVSCADVYYKLVENPAVIQACDFISPNIYPFWEGVPVECAMMRFHEAYLTLLPFKAGKEIFISECGWKTSGPTVIDAVPSIENAIRYNHELLSWSKSTGNSVNIFSAFDEAWKLNDDGWGIFYNNLILKPGIQSLFTAITSIDSTWVCKKPKEISNDALVIDYIPAIGTSDQIKGHVTFLPPCDYKIATYIKVGNGWWTKPTFVNPTVPIQCTGKWSVNFVTGGSDALATDVCVLLVPAAYQPPLCSGCGAIPSESFQNALSSKCIKRYILQSASLTSTKESICGRDTVTLTATGGTSYIWSNGETQASIKVSPASSAIYNVTITDGNGGGIVLMKSITILPKPTPAININRNNLCPGDTATLSASDGVNYKWNTGQTTSMIKVSPLTSTNYILTVANASGCSDTISIIVNQDIRPKDAYAVPRSICDGESATVYAGMGEKYSWNNGGNLDTIRVSPSITTIFNVKTSTINGCTYVSQDTIFVNPNPMVKLIANPSRICLGDTVLLTASGGISYNWTNFNINSNSIKIALKQSTTFEVTASNDSGCTSSTSIVVPVSNKPVLSIAVNPVHLCPNDTAKLEVSGGTAYLWNNGQTSESIKVSPKINTSYSIIGTNAEGCTDSISASVYLDIIPARVEAIPNLICPGNFATLYAGNASVYQWNNGKTSDTIQVSPLVTSIYSVKLTSINGCTYTSEDTVVVFPSPIITLKAIPESICQGDSVLLVAHGGPPYEWIDLGLTSDSVRFVPTQSREYKVSVTNDLGCTSLSSFTVRVGTRPDLKILLSKDTIMTGQTATLTAIAEPGVSYLWHTGDSNRIINVSPTVSTTYSVRVTNKDGCSTTDSIRLTVLNFPTVKYNAIFPFHLLKIYPNPAKDIIWIDIMQNNLNSIEISLINNLGNVLEKRMEKPFFGAFRSSFDLSKFPGGIYFLKFKPLNSAIWMEKISKI